MNHANINNFWETALREQLQNRDLRKIEFRTSIPEAYSEFKKDVVHFLRAYIIKSLQKIIVIMECPISESRRQD